MFDFTLSIYLYHNTITNTIMPFTLGGVEYKRKCDVRAKVQQIYKALSDGEEVPRGPDFDFLADFFTWHPELPEKLCNGTLEAIKKDVYRGPYLTRSFFIRSSTRDWIDISFNVTIRQYTLEELRRLRFKPALRLLVKEQIDAFRGDACPRTYHVDHTGDREFRHLVQDFIDEYKVDVDSLQWHLIPAYETEEYMFDDEELQQQWKDYHREHAQLQLITKQKNLRKRKRR